VEEIVMKADIEVYSRTIARCSDSMKVYLVGTSVKIVSIWDDLDDDDEEADIDVVDFQVAHIDEVIQALTMIKAGVDYEVKESS